MALLDRIQTDMVAAMRAKEEMKLNAIRMIKTALKKHEVDSMKPLDEATELQILGMLIKQRREGGDVSQGRSRRAGRQGGSGAEADRVLHARRSE
jgi:uncharacterized protein YqeY